MLQPEAEVAVRSPSRAAALAQNRAARAINDLHPAGFAFVMATGII
jgi:muramoyltetrapeptide carboxypeptidase LdcA involved in peptidoglycan recycling